MIASFFSALAVLLPVESVEAMGDSRRHGLAFLVLSLVFWSFISRIFATVSFCVLLRLNNRFSRSTAFFLCMCFVLCSSVCLLFGLAWYMCFCIVYCSSVFQFIFCRGSFFVRFLLLMVVTLCAFAHCYIRLVCAHIVFFHISIGSTMRDTLRADDGLNDDRLVSHALRGFGANLK